MKTQQKSNRRFKFGFRVPVSSRPTSIIRSAKGKGSYHRQSEKRKIALED